LATPWSAPVQSSSSSHPSPRSFVVPVFFLISFEAIFQVVVQRRREFTYTPYQIFFPGLPVTCSTVFLGAPPCLLLRAGFFFFRGFPPTEVNYLNS